MFLESGVAADRRGLGAVPRDQQAAACADPGVVVGIGEKNLHICEQPAMIIPDLA